ncbi:MaoC family dehydratase [Hyphomicrobiales bacterium]|nr:MaoC family dehydratase [Hyphomicrobiales bacterium]MDB4247073.1 MaoC family dehydratase [Hyphomicrobiales bacterium]
MYNEGSSLKSWNFLVNQESMNVWAEILDDPNPIHLDINSARLLGLGEGTINQGPANIAYIMNMIEKNFPGSQIIKMNNKMTSAILEGDQVTVSGQIIKIQEKDNKSIISCSINLKTDENKVAVTSEVDVLVL